MNISLPHKVYIRYLPFFLGPLQTTESFLFPNKNPIDMQDRR